MTPTDEARFIQLWQEGASYRDIAQALGCPLGPGRRAYLLGTRWQRRLQLACVKELL
jgi:DNA-directed RNA polymerase specialized sigma24 family protein